MKTKTKPRMNGVSPESAVTAKHITIKGKRMVQLDEAEFDRLLRKADLWEPLMPEPDANGNYPAVEAVTVSLALDIIRHRRRLGLTQLELARRAGIRLATLDLIESGVRRETNVRAIKKIDDALSAAEKEKANGKPT